MPAKDPAVPTDATLGYTFQNDFLALSRAFSLPDIDYHDISRREQLNAALKRWPLLAEFAEKNKEAGDGYSGITGRARGTGVTSITAALAWALQLLGETVLAIDASPDNMLRFFSIPISIIRTAGRGRCSTAGTGATRVCAIRSISICCRLASSAPAKEKMSTSCSPRWGRWRRLYSSCRASTAGCCWICRRLFAVDPRAADALRSLAGGGSSRRQ
jgi:hypothetical protein